MAKKFKYLSEKSLCKIWDWYEENNEKDDPKAIAYGGFCAAVGMCDIEKIPEWYRFYDAAMRVRDDAGREILKILKKQNGNS